jgi:hypothetical protein
VSNWLEPALASEFRKSPRGRHSPALQHLLSVMRLPQHCLDLMIVVTVPHCEWRVAVGGVEGVRPRYLAGTYASVTEAEWAIFRMRWDALAAAE